MKRKAQSTYRITIDAIEVEVTQKAIKNLYLRVKRPSGHVSVSAPLRTRKEDIEAFVRSRLDWIYRQRERGAAPLHQSFDDILDNGHMSVFGEAYFLKIQRGATRNDFIKDGQTYTMLLKSHVGEGAERALLKEFYRAKMKPLAEAYVKQWEEHMGVACKEWRIKDMKTKWGSCNIKDRRLWFSLYLAQYPQACLEFIVVHELCHLLERGHNKRFYGYIDAYLPDWCERMHLLQGR